jgi:hypothetical protein
MLIFKVLSQQLPMNQPITQLNFKPISNFSAKSNSDQIPITKIISSNNLLTNIKTESNNISLSTKPINISTINSTAIEPDENKNIVR